MLEGDPRDGAGGELLMTIRDASRATGLSVKAIRRRIERGTLPAEMVNGMRRVPMGELLRAGLLVTRPDERRPDGRPSAEAVGELTRRLSALEARVAMLEGERDGGRDGSRDAGHDRSSAAAPLSSPAEAPGTLAAMDPGAADRASY